MLSHGGHLHILRVSSSSKCGLAILLLLELGQVRLHIECLLRLVQGVYAGLEELVLDLVILFLGIGNLLSWLVVTEFASFCEDSDVSYGVDLLQTHLELVKKAQGNATLSLHDLVHHFGVKLDVQVPQRGLQLLKVLQSMRNCIPDTIFKSCNGIVL